MAFLPDTPADLPTQPQVEIQPPNRQIILRKLYGSLFQFLAVFVQTISPIFKPRRGGLFIETDAVQIPFFLFFGGAELDGGHGMGSVAPIHCG